MLIKAAQKEKRAYGTWPSPISEELLAGDSITLQDVVVNETTGQIFHLESRPSEGGRGFIVEHTKDGRPRDVLPQGHDYNVRSTVNGYGGAAIAVHTASGGILFTDSTTGGVYAIDPDVGHVTTIAPSQEGVRYAGFEPDPASGWRVLAIMETKQGSTTTNALVMFNLDREDDACVIAQGADFYSNVHWSPSGKAVCWTEWSLRDMPWTGTELYTALASDGERDDGGVLLDEPVRIAGRSRQESVSQPCWGPDGSLFFASDRSGYWKLHHLPPGASEASELRFDGWDAGEKAEFSSPEWQLGLSTYALLTPTLLLARYTLEAADGLVLLDLATNSYVLLSSPYTQISTLRRVSASTFALIASTRTSPPALYELSIDDPAHARTLAVSADPQIPTTFYSTPEQVAYPRADGSTAYAWLFPPQNPHCCAPADDARPPLIVSCHGGPTSHRGPGLDLAMQYWTSRGFAYAEVNHAGSSGFGRAYRERLYGEWGVADVADLARFADYMTSGTHPRADRSRVGIVGGSAGGYAVLASLAANLFPWAGGISLYGIGNLSLLEAHTHKFESRYTELMLLPRGRDDVGEEEKERIYRERSPAFHAERMKGTPVMLLQGAEDTVVPKEQAEEMARRIREVGGVVRFPAPFEGEGHGFRKKETLLKVTELEGEWWAERLVREGGGEEEGVGA